MEEQPKQDLSTFFARPSDEHLEQLIKTLEQVPEFQELVRHVPADLMASLGGATPDFLYGYLLGQDHAVMAIYGSAQAAQQGDSHTAHMIRQRRDLITLLVAKHLTGNKSRLILLH